MYKGASSHNVVKIKSVKEGKRIIDRIFNEGLDLDNCPANQTLSLSNIGFPAYVRKKIDPSWFWDFEKGILFRMAVTKDAIIFQKFLPEYI